MYVGLCDLPASQMRRALPEAEGRRIKTNKSQQGVTSTLARITSTLAMQLKYVIKKHYIAI
jgi:hypothetical protein